MRLISRKFALALAILSLAGWALLFEATPLDQVVQDLFYSPASHEWLVSKRWKIPRALFYQGPKVLLIGYGIWLVASLAHRSRAGSKALSRLPASHIWYLLVCLGVFPLLIALAKDATGHHCPSELARYGGTQPYRTIMSTRPDSPNQRGHCFPAGHASGGFALLSLCFVSRTRARGLAALALALGSGWAMGLYQMLNGSHFLSHTVATMLLAWIFALLMAFLFRLPSEQPTHNDSDHPLL